MASSRSDESALHDSDLLSLIPGVEEIVGDVADVPLYTHGTVREGRLGSAAVWNGYSGMIAYFGFDDPAKPEPCGTNRPVVQCTFLEALRDSWGKYQLLVERMLVFSGFSYRDRSMALLYDARGHRPLEAEDRAQMVDEVKCGIRLAADRLRLLQQRRAERARV